MALLECDQNKNWVLVEKKWTMEYTLTTVCGAQALFLRLSHCLSQLPRGEQLMLLPATGLKTLGLTDHELKLSEKINQYKSFLLIFLRYLFKMMKSSVMHQL